MPHACRIYCATVAGPDQALVRVGLIEADGRRVILAAQELIRAIERGETTCYVTLAGHSHLVMVTADASGRKTLATFVGELGALRLPECA